MGNEAEELKELKDYEIAIEQFKLADQGYRDAEEEITTGSFLTELLALSGGDPDRAKRDWISRWESLQSLLTERNVKLKAAQVALRQAVQLAPSQWRGPDGRATKIEFAGFEASSVTTRFFDTGSLFNLVRQKGEHELAELLTLTKIDKDGKEQKLVKEAWEVDYAGVFNWLQAKGFKDIIDGAYDEKEKTPQVRGAKPKGLLGEDKKGE